MRQKLLSGATSDEILLAGPQVLPTDWSTDGRFIVYMRHSAGSPDVWLLPLIGDRKPFAFAQTAAPERNPAIAPDGKWIAYQSSETGQWQVYVQPVPATSGKYLVSINGGKQPTWRSDGKELFFLGPDSKIMAVAIDTTRQFEAGAPQALFSSSVANTTSSRQYAVSKDGRRFLVNARTERSAGTPLTVVVNWLATMQK